MKKRKLEVLSPAGDMERVKMALAYGADAVYISGPEFGMRPGSRFSMEELSQSAALCHSAGARLYITCNTTPSDEEMARMSGYLHAINDAGADAIIVGDIGVLALAKKHVPDLEVHISTQCGVLNAVTAETLYNMGAVRVVPAREMSIEALRTFCAMIPKAMEVEVFVHGSMCVSFSGRCLLSNYIANRDVYSGNCAQPCRWKYALMEERRPGEYFEISEDGGTYILNSHDMCMIDHIKELYDIGVSSIKIEGRTKSAYYVALATNAYRHAADAAMKGEAMSEIWSQELQCISHRPYSTGFYYGPPGQRVTGSDYYSDSDFIAVVDSCDINGNAVIRQRNKFTRGETLEIVIPGGGEPASFSCSELEDENGMPVTVANKVMQPLKTVLPVQVPPLSILRRRIENRPAKHRTEASADKRI